MTKSETSALVERLREIANTIARQPVMGHWPHMKSHIDAECVRTVADSLERLQRELDEANEAREKAERKLFDYQHPF